MNTVPPVFADPSSLYLNMFHPPPPSPPPSAPARKQSQLLEFLKILVGIFIVLMLGAILLVLVIVPRTSNEIDLRESNEKIARLQRESNENISRVQRESNENSTRVLRERDLEIQKQRLERQENITEHRRLEDRLIQSEQHQRDAAFAMEQLRQHLQIEQRRLQILLEDRQITEQHRKEDLSRVNAELLSDFMQEVATAKEPLNDAIVQLKVESLLRRFDAQYKSLLIGFLYKMKYINSERPAGTILDLKGANLKDIDLDDMDTNSGHVGVWLNYSQLSLPGTILSNASFEQLHLNNANFTSSDMMGASFRWSNVIQADFSRAILTLSTFRHAKILESNFSNVKMQRATFQNADLSQSRLTNSDFDSTNFQEINATQTSFSHSELSNTDFRYANLYQAQMDHTSIRSANFYNLKASQANFTHSYLSNCMFQWADLSYASFRNAFMPGTNFENANVHNVDFTRATFPGALITQGQLDVALSIANTILPDGSKGRNKNLVNNGHAQCTGSNDTTPYWNNTGDVFTNEVQLSTECVFQSRISNAILQQRIDARRYERLIQQGESKVFIEMQVKSSTGSASLSNPSAYMNVRFFDSHNNESGAEQSTLNQAQFTPPSTFVAILPCPSTTVELQLTLVFVEVNATVDNIYVTFE